LGRGFLPWRGDPSHYLAHGHLVAGCETGATQHARFPGLYVDRGLVGLHGEERLAFLDLVALLFVPLEQDPGLHVVGQLGHKDF
jgi:hypothetical protein